MQRMNDSTYSTEVEGVPRPPQCTKPAPFVLKCAETRPYRPTLTVKHHVLDSSASLEQLWIVYAVLWIVYGTPWQECLPGIPECMPGSSMHHLNRCSSA